MLQRVLISALVLGLATSFAADSTAVAKKKIDLVQGKKIFETNCVICHGKMGKGDGPSAVALKPKPRNFTDTAYMAKEPLEKLHKVVAKGGASAGFSPLMPAWKGTLKDDQIDDVLGYILKTFSGEGTPRFEELSKAATTPKPKAQ